MTHSKQSDNSANSSGYNHDDVTRYYQAGLEIESNRHHINDSMEQISELEHSQSVELFQINGDVKKYYILP